MGLAMTELDTRTIVDLGNVDYDQRLSTWAETVPSLFPGMKLDRCPGTPSIGMVQHTSIANSHAWLIDSSPVRVVYLPKHSDLKSRNYVSVVLQHQGSMLIQQNLRTSMLASGDICLIDNHEPFMMEVQHSYSKFIAWQIPRESVLSQHPQLSKITAHRFSPDLSSAQIIRSNLVKTLETCADLEKYQQGVVLGSFIQLLGLLEVPDGDLPRPRNWRVSRALAVIEIGLSDSSFNADDVAHEQHISRRQLDRMFHEEIGMTITARIWDRRLSYAASLLKAQGQARTITDAAMSSGFEDAAHFTRAFKKKYGIPPRDWRSQ